MRIFDISIPLSNNTIVWPGDTPVRITRVSDMNKGDSCTVSSVSMSAHIGTHIDAPSHFIRDGRTSESIDLSILCGTASVIDLQGKKLVTSDELESAGIKRDTVRLLIKTDNSSQRETGEGGFHPDFVAVSPSGARWIAEHGIRLVGIDYLSIAEFENPAETHGILLSRGIVILEGLSLRSVLPGEYELYCLPLPFIGTDGIPARSILVLRD